jgi:NAD(P)-dependent dehydrogenase (short-subunit alcohol dehydrogenase family)
LIDPIGQIIISSCNTHNPSPAFAGEISYSNAESLAFPEKYNHNVQKGMRYCESKLCNIYFTYELTRRLGRIGSKVHVNTFNSELMFGTDFF